MRTTGFFVTLVWRNWQGKRRRWRTHPGASPRACLHTNPRQRTSLAVNKTGLFVAAHVEAAARSLGDLALKQLCVFA